MARGGRSRGGHHGSDNNTMGSFQASISASTLSPDPPYNRYFSIPIPVVDTQFHRALKRAIQKQKSQTNEQRITLANAEAARHASINEARNRKIESFKIELKKAEDQARISGQQLELANEKLEATSKRIQSLLEKKTQKEKEEQERIKKFNDDKKLSLEKKKEEQKQVKEKLDEIRANLASLRADQKKKQEILDKLTQEEEEWNERKKKHPTDHSTDTNEISGKRKREDVGNENDENKKSNNGFSTHTSDKDDTSPDIKKTSTTVTSQGTENSELEMGGKKEHTESKKETFVEKEGKPSSILLTADEKIATTKVKVTVLKEESKTNISTVKGKLNENNISEERQKKMDVLEEIQKKVDGLHQTKSQMIWLLKQVIKEEKKQKDAEKKRLALQENKKNK